MAAGDLIVRLFDKELYDRSKFRSSSPRYNEYLERVATQHTRKGLNALYVAIVEGQEPPCRVYAYMTLSMNGIGSEDVDPELRTELGMPRLRIPSLHIGMMAADEVLQGKRVGNLLITEAGKIGLRLRQEAGCWALTLDPDPEHLEELTAYYERRNFIKLRRDRGLMALPLRTFEQALSRKL